MKPLFIHQKLDWTVDRLDEQAAAAPDDPQVRVELARALVSRALFHGRGEPDFTAALNHVRKALGEDPANAEALALAGLALLGLDRDKAASRYLGQAARADEDHPVYQVAAGLAAERKRDPGAAVRHFERACRLAPEAWEAHLLLGRALTALAQQRGRPRRLVERAQYHLVQALKLDPPPRLLAPILRDLGVSCMWTGRFREAERFFIRLRDHERFAPIARYHLGEVAYQLGKYNNAVQHFRAYLRERPDDTRVLARMAMAFLQLGDFKRARETAHQALVVDPGHVEARYALGCTLLEEGEPAEAIKTLREALKDRPDHLPSYVELVRIRRTSGDVGWLTKALSVEVANFDRLPSASRLDPRRETRRRIRVLLDELRHVGPSAIPAILAAIHRTQNEALRFQLWEAACALTQGAVADEVAVELRAAGETFGPELAGRALAVAEALPEPVLAAGLKITERDLKRAAVDRHGPAHDVRAYQRHLDEEKRRARAHQALLLLAVGVRRSASGRRLLSDWAQAADSELAVAAWTGLAMQGDPEAERRLRRRADTRGARPVVDRLLQEVTPPQKHREPRRVGDDEKTRCSTCGRQPSEVTHMMAGGKVVICDRCVLHVRQHRHTLAAPDGAVCGLCGRTPFESAGVYRYNRVDICDDCLQLSLGLLEREEVERFLATF